ncbi:MAG: hypothetical protein HZB98_01040 [Bacteroidia bacterium]|nr:hypothetical protein [Bacteroidia bacterium]
MLQSIELPEELNISLGSESRDFAVKGTFAQPVIASVSGILFGAAWLGFTIFMMSFFLGPGFIKGAIQSFTSSESSASTEGGVTGYLFFIVFFGIFLSVGLYVFLKGIFSLLKRGGYFVGTPTRLVNFRRGRLISTDWEQFTGNISVRGNNKKGSITLVLRSGKMISGKGGSRYVPDVIYILGIEGAFDIEQICRKRIKENDPTPSS